MLEVTQETKKIIQAYADQVRGIENVALVVESVISENPDFAMVLLTDKNCKVAGKTLYTFTIPGIAKRPLTVIGGLVLALQVELDGDGYKPIPELPADSTAEQQALRRVQFIAAFQIRMLRARLVGDVLRVAKSALEHLDNILHSTAFSDHSYGNEIERLTADKAAYDMAIKLAAAAKERIE